MECFFFFFISLNFFVCFPLTKVFQAYFGLGLFFFLVIFSKCVFSGKPLGYGYEVIGVRKYAYNCFVFLKKSFFFQCVYLIDVVVRDFYRRKARFQLTYILRSLKYNFLFMFSFFTQEIVPFISLISLYHCANWLEREIWDLFGIYFFYHKDLRRLLTDYNFLQFPLRKDFPLTGFFDLFYNDNKKVIQFSPISLVQEYRFFILQNVW